jgi:hypothetical protein
MTADEAIKRAINVMGEGKTDDYILSPTSHAKEFEGKTPEIVEILKSRVVAATAQEYEDKDREALSAQQEFKRVFSRANGSVLATGVFIAILLATGATASWLPAWLVKTLIVTMSLGSVITGALASKDLVAIRQGHLLESWMSKRASAETARMDYFEKIVESPIGSTAEQPFIMEMLKLEYFRRFQLDVQLAFYSSRGKDHREDAKKTLSYSSWAVAGAAIATGSAGVLGSSVHTSFAAIGAIGTIFAGLSSFASMREAVNQDRRNAERYERTYGVLNDLNKKLDDVRNAVSNAGMDPLAKFVDAVHEHLSLEHRQWLQPQGPAGS